MGKRETFEKNLRASTGRARLKDACNGLAPVEVIDLSGSLRHIACELCGTRFQRGAWMRLRGRRSSVAVRGTCLVSVLGQRFGGRPRVDDRQRALIRGRYGGMVYPGALIGGGDAVRALATEAESWERLQFLHETCNPRKGAYCG